MVASGLPGIAIAASGRTMRHSSVRWILVSGFLLGAIVLVFAAPFATPLGFAHAEFGMNGWAAIRDLSPFNRDIQYLVLIAAGFLLCASCIVTGDLDYARLRHVMAGNADRRLPAWMLVAFTSIVACALAFANFAGAYAAQELPLHEGEWLGYLLDDAPFLHGWVVNVLPTRICNSTGFDLRMVGCGRVLRIGWACIAYAFVPIIFYQLFRYDSARLYAALASLIATLVFGLVDHKLYGFYYAGFETLSTAPVRGTPLLMLMAIVAFAGRIATRQVGRRWSGILGAAIPLAFLANILSGPLGLALVGMLTAGVGIVRNVRDGMIVLAWTLTVMALVILALWLVIPAPLAASGESFRYFGAIGRNTFADETPWLAAGSRTTLLLRYAEIPLYVGTIAITSVAALMALRQGSLGTLVSRNLPAFLIAVFTGLTFLLVTGVAVSAFGLAILVPFLLVRYLPWGRSFALPHTDAPPFVIAWPYLAGTAFMLISLAVMLVSATYFGVQSARAALAMPDRARAGFRDTVRLRQILSAASQTCVVSLTSDGTLLLAARRPACLSRHQPLYAGPLVEQRRAVLEIDQHAPRYIHVTSDVIDNPYIVQTHAPAIWRYVQTHYRPGFILDGRWFWKRAPEPIRSFPPSTAAISTVGAIVRRDREAIVAEWPLKPVDTIRQGAGIALRCADGRICALGVAEAYEDRMRATLKTPPAAAGGEFDVLLWQPERQDWAILAQSRSSN